MSKLPESKMPYPPPQPPPGLPIGEAPGGVDDEPGHGLKTAACHHARHEVIMPANRLPVPAQWEVVTTLLALTNVYDKASFLGVAADGGPILCVCPGQDTYTIATNGGIVALAATVYGPDAAEASVPPGTSRVGMRWPETRPTYICGASDEFVVAVRDTAVEAEIQKEVQRGLDAIDAHLKRA